MDKKEVVKVVRDGKYYVAKPVNVGGVIAQAETLPELNRKLTVGTNSMLNVLKQSIDNGFIFYEVEDLKSDLNVTIQKPMWESEPNDDARYFDFTALLPSGKCKYLIQYQSEGKNRVKVGDFTDDELEKFCQGEYVHDCKVTFLKDTNGNA